MTNKAMIYHKPELVFHGDANRAIEHVDKPNGSAQDGNVKNGIPAYDLDE